MAKVYTYVAVDLIPILFGSLPLAHNAQHSLVIGASVSEPPLVDSTDALSRYIIIIIIIIKL